MHYQLQTSAVQDERRGTRRLSRDASFQTTGGKSEVKLLTQNPQKLVLQRGRERLGGRRRDREEILLAPSGAR
jgi:hypothetical protein